MHALELGVLVLQFTQLRKVRDGQAAVLAFPLVVSGLADSVLSARLADLGTEFDFFQDADDLAFAEFLFLYAENLLGDFLYFQLAQDFKEASDSRKGAVN